MPNNNGGSSYWGVAIAALLSATISGGIAYLNQGNYNETTAPALSGSGKAVLYFDSGAHNMQVSQNGGAFAAVGGATFANPTQAIDGSAHNGSASTAMRSDAAPPLANTTVSAGSYLGANITVDAQGRLTAASNGQDPVNGYTIFDDFVGSYFAGSNHAQGPFYFTSGNSGTASGVSNPTGLDTSSPGVIQMETGTDTTGKAYIYGEGSSGIFGGGTQTFEWRVQLSAISDGTNTYTARVGWGVSTTGDSSNAVQFRYTHSVNSGNWQAVCRSGGSESTGDTTVAAAGGSWVRLKCVVNAGGTSVDFYVNGVNKVTVASNVPNGTSHASGLFCSIIKSAGGTDRSLYADYCLFSFSPNGR